MPRRGISLTEDQWALIKSRAAERRQTISQYVGDLLGPTPLDIVEDRSEAQQRADGDLKAAFRPFTPAPKPGKGAKR